MTERKQLEQAIVALEAQRSVLGDAVVDPAIVGLRKQLAELEPISKQARKQATVLFADICGFTTMSEKLDVEEVSDMIGALWKRIDAVIVEYGGVIDKHIGDAVMALWGVDEAREDDPERAIRAALAAQAELAEFREDHNVQLSMRVGLNTGLVFVGELMPGEFTALGDAVNLASRLEQVAPVGGVLISHDTYRHVRGIFDVTSREPLEVKGKSEPVQTYIVHRAKPHAFRTTTRGVEGVETHMVGRNAELLILQNTFRDAMEDGETRIVTVVGEAGVGKSRLLYEFENWIELLPDRVIYFKGRATPEMQSLPYSIVRDMFAHRFDIRESDSSATVLKKFRTGMDGVIPLERADLVGHLIGFDFSVSPEVSKLLGNPSFSELAMAYLINYIREIASEPTVIFMEDLHWVDDSSLSFIGLLIDAIPDAHLLIVCLTRPQLFERHPDWGEGWTAHNRLNLNLLSRRASRVLVSEILQKVDQVPQDLCDLIINSADGNPFYIEELVKMLIEEGVILHTEEEWRVEPDRLAEASVPPTLTGVLQARLDSLPHAEKMILQRASVVGRLFWDAAVIELGVDENDRIDGDRVDALLNAIRKREFVFQREPSAFEATEEYLFKHAMLHEVAYETVLLKLRRIYHKQVARWLEANVGERAGEYLGVIARHYELAGKRKKAAKLFHQLGQELSRVGAFRDATGPFERALVLLPDDYVVDQARVLVDLGNAYDRLGDFSEAIEQFERALTLVSEPSQETSRIAVAALNGQGWSAWQQGNHNAALVYLKKGLALARNYQDRYGMANALRMLGRDASSREGNYEKAERYIAESLSLYRELGGQQGIASALRVLAVIALLQGKHEEAKKYLKEGLALHREIGDQRGIAGMLIALGENARKQERHTKAIEYYEKSLIIANELGYWWIMQACLNNLGHVYVDMGQDDTAWHYLGKALREAVATEAAPYFTLETLIGIARLQARARSPRRAAELLGLVMANPAFDEATKQYADSALVHLREMLPADELDAALVRGRSMDYKVVIVEILEEIEDIVSSSSKKTALGAVSDETDDVVNYDK